MSTLTTTTTTVRGVSVPSIVTHSKFNPRVKLSDGLQIVEECIISQDIFQNIKDIDARYNPLSIFRQAGLRLSADPSTSSAATSAGINMRAESVADKRKESASDCGESRSCCHHEGLEGRLSSSNKQCARDLPGTENFRTCDGDHHSECSSQADECHHHESSPCDCCGHGHSLTSFIRGPEDCRTCLRHMGGSFVSPKYPQIRQRMLETLIKRRDHSEDSSESRKSRAEPPPCVKSIPCGKKERLIILNPENPNDNVDDLVRMIEGGGKMSNDPRKLAKKARQKEKKMQVKFEEDMRREEEERRIKEEAERLLREQEEREEEERRRSEEQKRQARRQKKKNRKKKETEKADCESLHSTEDGGSVVLKASSSSKGKDNSLVFSVSNTNASPSENVLKVVDTVKPADDVASPDKPRMVTIRRHPATQDNQNVVTITLSDDKEGKSPVYMLLNGHLVSTDNAPDPGQPQLQQPPQQRCLTQTGEVTTTDKKKKNKNKKKPLKNETYANEESVSEHHLQPQNRNNVTNNSTTAPLSADVYSVDLGNLSLPPGITITKVPNRSSEKYGSYSPQRSAVPQEQTSHFRVPHDQLQYVAVDDDFLGRKETEEFEEVINNKTRRKRMKAAKTTTEQRDGSDGTDTRESPNSVKHMVRRSFISDVKLAEKPIEVSKVGITGGKCSKVFSSSKKPNGKPAEIVQPKPRREQPFRHDGFSATPTQVPVMPRLLRAQMKNGDGVSLPNSASVSISAINHPSQSSIVDSSVSDVKPTMRMEAPITVEKTFVTHPAPSPQLQYLGNRGNGAPTTPVTMTSWTPLTATPIGRSSSAQAAEVDKSWNPWKDWSDNSTKEHPSYSVFGNQGDVLYRDAPPKTYAFHELVKQSKSPIQRPGHNLDIHLTQHNGAHDNRASYHRDVSSSSYVSFQQSHQYENVYQRYQQRPDPPSFSPNTNNSYGPLAAHLPTDTDKGSWNAFSGVNLQSRRLTKEEFGNPMHGSIQPHATSDMSSWEMFPKQQSPLQVTTDRLNNMSLSPMQMMSSNMPPVPYRIGPYQQHEPTEQYHPPSAPGQEWQARPPSSNQNFGKSPYDLPQEDSYNWQLGPSYSRYTGGGAV
ncbi:zinc finger CCCH domain-containing protein 13 isoform X1 [Folsomia candida]|uniref:zinc finger CCCH domain-containing protein 13 isoform X1 n=1 Tax=Folsomia candida TaxID=158441 RepID=UPI000B900A78|nr:zinc finger CCCH domain-containing protein 13 isoform X1 [Folsomia candida]